VIVLSDCRTARVRLREKEGCILFSGPKDSGFTCLAQGLRKMSRKPVIKTAAGTFSLEGIETLGAAIKQDIQLLMKGELISLIAQDGRRSRTQELLVADRAAAVVGL